MVAAISYLLVTISPESVTALKCIRSKAFLQTKDQQIASDIWRSERLEDGRKS